MKGAGIECDVSIPVPGPDVGPIVEERAKKVGMSGKRAPLKVKEASEKKRLGFDVQNPFVLRKATLAQLSRKREAIDVQKPWSTL